MSGRFIYDPYGYNRYFEDHSRWVEHYPGSRMNERREKHSHPYSYSEFFHVGSNDVIQNRDLNLESAYSDRLVQWDHEKYRLCSAVASNKHGNNVQCLGRADWWQTLLNEYYPGRHIKVRAVAEGCNPSNGYPYWIIWWTQSPDNPTASHQPAIDILDRERDR